MDLSSVPTGGFARVLSVDLDEGPRVRLRELGVRPGGELRVTQRGAFGGLVVGVGADRFAVDASTAASIRVAPVVGPAAPAAGPTSPTGTPGGTP
ncbi:FeoA family protein [Cellulomonas xiejunii]|uniref:FeoA family protein n=1 Tax=Cellulomonas xiejunii TaxID=2968083 RepID=UPI001D0DF4F2|nr:ferrous iron transport protein A [Cellulomonas xiejunii]MCC2313890.1 ferrous iron transport protein A [Cellulomonas xiejunii]